MALTGSLKDMSLTSLIAVNCNGMNQARLVVRHEDQEGTIYFEGGNIVHIVLGSQEGAEVIQELLTWDDGEFAQETGVAAPRVTVRKPWSTLLLEGIQKVDEDQGQAVLQPATATPGSMPSSTPFGPTVPARWGETTESLATGLRAIEGVQGVVIMARDGVILAAELEGDPEKEGAIAIYVGTAATQIGESLALGPFERGIVQMGSGSTKMLVVEKPDYYVGLLLAERASPTMVATQVATILSSQ